MPLRSRPELGDVIDLLMDAVCVVDDAGHFIYVSAAGERLFGYRPDEMIGRSMIDFVAPEDRERTLGAAAEVMAGRMLPHFENCYLHKDGRRVHLMWSARWSETHRLRVAVARDVSEQRLAQRTQQALYAISEAAHEAQDLAALLRQLHAILGELLPVANLTVWLREQAQGPLHTVYRVDERDGTSAVDVVHPLALRVIESGQPLLQHAGQANRSLRCPDGRPLACWLGLPLRGRQGVAGVLALHRYAGACAYGGADLALLQYVSTQIATAIERKRLQARLAHLAHYDALTGLPNRGLLFDRLDGALARSRRSQQPLALLFVDLDGFKRINDDYGHAVGDRLLVAVAQRLREAVREADSVARIGGDEFVVVLEAVGDAANAARIAQTLQKRLDTEWQLDGLRIHSGASIGLALFPEQAIDAGSLLRLADDAMYRRKRERLPVDALLGG